MRTIHVRQWTELCDLVLTYRKDGYWIFRGVSLSTYPLVPKIGRPDSRKRITDGHSLPYSAAGERRMVDAFSRAALPYLNHTPKSRLEWLAVAQHHGAATRLLDWTESLFVAAYFAVRASKQSPTIYAVGNVPIADPKLHDRLDRLPGVALYHPPHLSPRIPAQRSVFTVHKFPARNYQPASLHKILLQRAPGPTPSGTAPITYRLNLDAVGINDGTMFPDIDGLANQVSWLYKWDRLPPTP